jgi:hypothetical protein
MNQQVPLPIPKNVVLLSLMEAAERQALDDAKRLAKEARKVKQQQLQQQPQKLESPRERQEEEEDRVVGSDLPRRDRADGENADLGEASDGEDDDDDDDDDEEEEFNLDRIISGLATLSGPCGTYAVTADDVVVVQPHDPRTSSSAASAAGAVVDPVPAPPPCLDEEARDEASGDDEKKADEDDDDSFPAGILKVVPDEQGAEVAPVISDGGEATGDRTPVSSSTLVAMGNDSDDCKGSLNSRGRSRAAKRAESLLVLRKGQKVQVVSLEDGVAKLARGMGYIVLGSTSHLVKGNVTRREQMQFRTIIHCPMIPRNWLEEDVPALTPVFYLILVNFPSTIRTVSGPQETVCRLEGLLDTIEERGRGLQATLNENQLVELSLRGQIKAEMQSEPNHPVIENAPELDLWDEDGDDDKKQGKNEENWNEHPSTPRTPDGRSPTSNARRHSGSHSIEPGSAGSVEARVGNSYSQSPASIDNADLQRGNSIPVYRRTVSEDDIDQLVFGCGVALLGQGSTGLFSGGAPNIMAPFETLGDLHDEYNNAQNSNNSSSVQQARPRSATDHYHHHQSAHDYYGAPTLTSSFDGIDFRTGMSGHRGLNHAASKSGTHHSPTPRYRQMRMMSEHRGIARVRTPPSRQPQRDSPTTTPGGTVSSTSMTLPAFGPRFSPYPFASAAAPSEGRDVHE